MLWTRARQRLCWKIFGGADCSAHLRLACGLRYIQDGSSLREENLRNQVETAIENECDVDSSAVAKLLSCDKISEPVYDDQRPSCNATSIEMHHTFRPLELVVSPRKFATLISEEGLTLPTAIIECKKEAHRGCVDRPPRDPRIGQR